MLGILIAFICIGGATIIVTVKELKQMPAVLMRPKPPKNGKRIFLERIKFIWKKLNFSNVKTAMLKPKLEKTEKVFFVHICVTENMNMIII